MACTEEIWTRRGSLTSSITISLEPMELLARCQTKRGLLRIALLRWKQHPSLQEAVRQLKEDDATMPPVAKELIWTCELASYSRHERDQNLWKGFALFTSSILDPTS